MPAIKVTSEELTQTSGMLQTGASEIAERLTSMRSNVDGLISAGWQGNASQSFNELYQQWNTAGAKLQEALLGIATQVQRAATAYEETESAVAQSMRV